MIDASEARRCSECGNVLKSYQRMFCGHACRGSAKRKLPHVDYTRPCKICGVPVNRRVRSPGGGVVCSSECLRESRRRTGSVNAASGKGPPRNTMTEAQREAARQRITGPNAPWWTGAKMRSRVRYVMLHPQNYPFPESLDAQGYIPEHRAVMEAHLGRALLATEVVHHINEDKRDNRLDNLMLFASQAEHIRHHRMK